MPLGVEKGFRAGYWRDERGKKKGLRDVEMMQRLRQSQVGKLGDEVEERGE